jgi:RNA polymerase sigma factor (TIGR02999 family)
MSDVPSLLTALSQGDPHAASELLPLVYNELRRLAAHRLAHEAPGQSLQPTALVHEAYLRLVGGGEQHWNGRGHFFAAAAEAMRRILIETARRKKRIKHGGGRQRVELDEIDLPVGTTPEELLALDEALGKLALEDPPAAEVVKLHFFAGLTMDETAAALGVGRSTAYRQWTYAKAWLHTAVRGVAPDSTH